MLSNRPRPPDRLVNRDERCRCRSTSLLQLVFRIEQRSLRIQHLQEVGESRLEPLLRQVCRAGARAYRALEDGDARVRPIIRYERSLALLERSKNRRVVCGLCFFLSRLRDLDSLSHAADVEQREAHYRADQQPGIASPEQRIN